ncbi:ornithine decarboxylase [Bauldia sp.]|uniref:ornithine decarboxylase n=1 Tax=Bauldia sp. TaxID=2575872 RepID=UPI003BABE467
MKRFAAAREVVQSLRPDQPIYCFRPGVLAADARAFVEAFPGKTAYAVKTNSEPMVLDTLASAGVSCFDVASPAEFEAARAVNANAELLYTHPVKAQSDIRLALERYGIRVLALDHEDEVAKILRIVRGLDLDPEEITLLVRIAVRGQAAYELSKKFGAAPGHAVELVKRIYGVGFKVGLCFHVGSQVADTGTYERAIASVAWVRSRAGVPLALLDIGGGFPAPYGHDPRQAPPPRQDTQALVTGIVSEIGEWGLDDIPLVAEPGRVIVARSFSLIVRVLLRKGRRLYINDGIWASLSDSWTGKITLPARLLPDSARRKRAGNPDSVVPFKVCGATCDSVDILSRPFYLPETVGTGDWIEIGHIGAYSLALRTRFNGFYPDTFVEVTTPFEAAGPAESLASLETMAD